MREGGCVVAMKSAVLRLVFAWLGVSGRACVG